MTNTISKFTFNANELRTVDIDGAPWFAGADVLRILYGQTQGMAHRYDKLDADEKRKVLSKHLSYHNRPAWIITESGLYKLIMRSDKPEAREFQNWVTREVLPAMTKEETRRYHRYMGAVDQRASKLRKAWRASNPEPQCPQTDDITAYSAYVHRLSEWCRQRLALNDAISAYQGFERLQLDGIMPETSPHLHDLREHLGLGWVSAETLEERKMRLREEAQPAMAAMHAYGLLEAC